MPEPRQNLRPLRSGLRITSRTGTTQYDHRHVEGGTLTGLATRKSDDAPMLVTVDEVRINTTRPSHPPTSVNVSACGEPASDARVHQVMEGHSEMLEEWGHWAVWVLAADLLDDSRMSTGRRGIRVVHVLPQNVLADSPLRNLPECLDGVPVQLVVRPDD